METLFRFILARPAQRVNIEKGTVPVRPSQEYHAQLKEARVSSDPRTSLKRAALGWAVGEPRPPHYTRGYGRLFLDHVLQAHEGCDFDFLRGKTPVRAEDTAGPSHS